MQFDLGAVSSILYSRPLKDISQKYPKYSKETSAYAYNISIELGDLVVSYDSIKQINYGKSIDWSRSDHKVIIGTLGADFAERVKAIIDFPNSQISFSLEGPNSLPETHFEIPIEFQERKLMLNTLLNGKAKKLMWDSGASAYDLITSEKAWRKMAINQDQAIIHPANQFNRKLKVYTAKTHQKLDFDSQSIPLKTVTYIEGFPWYIQLAFSTSGMEGMIGNNIFRDRQILLDIEDRKLILYP